MKNIGKIISGAVLFTALTIPAYNSFGSDDAINVDPDKKKKFTLEEQCENSKRGIYPILQAMGRGAIERFSTPLINSSNYPRERFDQEMQCVKKYVENESGGRYSVSEEKIDKKIPFKNASGADALKDVEFIRFIIYKKTDKA